MRMQRTYLFSMTIFAFTSILINATSKPLYKPPESSKETLPLLLQHPIHQFSLKQTAEQAAQDVDSPYSNTATLDTRADPPPNHRQQVLSILLHQENFTQPLNVQIKTCAANATDTDPENWGLFSAKRFLPDVLQAEYFVDVLDQRSGGFNLKFYQYLSSGGLADCVGVATNHIVEGRTPDEDITVAFKRTKSNLGKFLGPLLLGIFALIALVVVGVLIMKNLKRKVPIEEYDNEDEEVPISQADISEADLGDILDKREPVEH